MIILLSVEVAKLSMPYKTALIFKFFSSHIPSFEVQRALSNWGVKGVVDINVIDRRHLLVKFVVESDFLMVYTRDKWVLKGQLLKVFRWTSWFRPGSENNIALVWVALPSLP